MGEWGTWKVEAAESRLEAQTTLRGEGGVGEAETGGRTLGKAFMQAAFELGLGR